MQPLQTDSWGEIGAEACRAGRDAVWKGLRKKNGPQGVTSFEVTPGSPAVFKNQNSTPLGNNTDWQRPMAFDPRFTMGWTVRSGFLMAVFFQVLDYIE